VAPAPAPHDEYELAQLVAEIAARPDLWRPLVHHEQRERHCVSLLTNAHVGIWVISWLPGHDTGWHDHAGVAGAVAVAEGSIREARPPWGAQRSAMEAAARSCFTFGGTDIHRVVAVGDRPAVTIHAYSPPLQAMGVYRTDENGAVTRTTTSWDETLVAA
jgi:predicted metal-dependent enzyme (double-stranded beta helix superfamily)